MLPSNDEFIKLLKIPEIKDAFNATQDLSEKPLEFLSQLYQYPFIFLCSLGFLTRAKAMWNHATHAEKELWLNHNNFSALHFARAYDQHATVDWLLTIADEKQKKMLSILTLKITFKLGYLDLANKLLNNLFSTNQKLTATKVYELSNAFSAACENNHFDVAKLILGKMKDEKQRKNMLCMAFSFCMAFSQIRDEKKLEMGLKVLALVSSELQQTMLCDAVLRVGYEEENLNEENFKTITLLFKMATAQEQQQAILYTAFSRIWLEKKLNLKMVTSLFNMATSEQQQAMLCTAGLHSNLDRLHDLLDIITPIQTQIILTSENYAVFLRVCHGNRPDLTKRFLDIATPEQKQIILCDRDILKGPTGFKNLELEVIQVLLDSATSEQKQTMISADDYRVIRCASYWNHLKTIEVILKSFYPETLEQKQALLYAMSKDYDSRKYQPDCSWGRYLASLNKESQDPEYRYSREVFKSAFENGYQTIVILFLDVLIPEHMTVLINWNILPDTRDLKRIATQITEEQIKAILSARQYLEFQSACAQGRPEILRSLLNNNPEQKQGLIQAGFKPACEAGHYDTVDLLLHLADETQQQTLIDLTVFKQVCACNYTKIARLLLDHISEALKESILTANHYELFQHACKNGYTGIVQLFLNTPYKSAMLNAIMCLDASVVQHQSTVFQTVCERRHLDLIKLLFEAADLEQKQNMVRVGRNHYDVFRTAVQDNLDLAILLLSKASSEQKLEMLGPGNHLSTLLLKLSPLQLLCTQGNLDTFNTVLSSLRPEQQKKLLDIQGLSAFLFTCSVSNPNQKILKRLFKLSDESQQAMMLTVYYAYFKQAPEFATQQNRRGISTLFPANSDSSQNPDRVSEDMQKITLSQ
jgi:hypothetical protein